MAKKRKVEQEPISLGPDSVANDPESESYSEEEEEEEEDLAKILEPFSKEQLIDLLRSTASNDPKLLAEIHRLADRDLAHRKIFVHGLGWETTSDTLRSFFAQYGEIEDGNVVVDKASGKSKGYGFVLFKRRRSAQKALKEPQKKIESRMTACQLASTGPFNPGAQNPQQQQHHQPSYPYQNQETLARKIYVGNVHSEMPVSKLLAFFSKYGEIEEGPLGFDRQTGKSKGYALFIYKTVEGARKALEEPNKNLDGHQLYCQKATDSHKLRSSAPTPVNNNPPSAPIPAGPGGGAGPPGAGSFNMGSSAGGGAGYAASDMAVSAALLGQGLLSGALPFGQGVPPNQAALAVLAAAGQNPAAFGIPPAVLASLNPAFAAAMNAAAPPPVAQPQVPPGFGMGNPGYQNMQGHQAPHPYQNAPMGQGPPPRPHSAVGPMGGYAPR